MKALQLFSAGNTTSLPDIFDKFSQILFTPHAHTTDEARKERVMLFILFSVVVLLWVFECTRIINYAHGLFLGGRNGLSSLVIYTILTVIFTILFILARKGHAHLISIVFVLLFFIGTVYGSIMWGVGLPIGLLSYTVAIVITSNVLGTKAGFYISIFSIITIVVVGSREITTGILPVWKQSIVQQNDLIEYSVTLGLMTVLMWLSNKELEKSLRRAQASEAALLIERSNLEQLVQERTSELLVVERDRLAQLTHFAEFGKVSAGLFHDLINPLTAVALAVGRLQTNTNHDLTVQAKKSVSYAIAATQKMEHFMATIRKNISPTPTLELFSINKEVAELIEMFHFKVCDLNVRIECKASEEIFFYGNCLKFNQVISNIVSNAVDAYLDSSQENTKRHVVITLKKNRETITITVIDYGKGIIPELQNKIFTPFISSKENGIGLGLPTAKEIIEKEFNGTIRFSTMENRGTTFTLAIPSRTF